MAAEWDAMASARASHLSEKIDNLPSRENWDSYGAVGTTDEAKAAVWRFLNAEVPWLGPSKDGGVTIEWDYNGFSLSLECDANGRWRSVSFEASPHGGDA